MNKSQDLENLRVLLKKITKLYLNNSSNIQSVGLFNGKTGLCIYFYYLAKKQNNADYKDLANKILDNIAEGIDESTGCDIEKGLAGIGIGIEFLVQNGYFEADTDDILEVIDNKVLHTLSFILLNDDTFNTYKFRTSLDILIYLIFRLRQRKIGYNPDIENLLKSGVVQIINYIDKNTSQKQIFIDEPESFNIFWNLPLYICCLAELYELKIYHYKIELIIDELSRIVLTNFPLLNCNRFYLYYSISRLTKSLPLPLWEEHAQRLLDSIDFKHILIKEFKNKQVYFNDGLLGFLSLCILAEKDLPGIWAKCDKAEFLTKLKNSEIIKDLDTEKFDYSIYGGIDRIAGIDLALRYLVQMEHG